MSGSPGVITFSKQCRSWSLICNSDPGIWLPCWLRWCTWHIAVLANAPWRYKRVSWSFLENPFCWHGLPCASPMKYYIFESSGGLLVVLIVLGGSLGTVYKERWHGKQQWQAVLVQENWRVGASKHKNLQIHFGHGLTRKPLRPQFVLVFPCTMQFFSVPIFEL